MPPPLPDENESDAESNAESNAESIADEMPHAKVAEKEDPDASMKEDDDEEEDEEGDEETYIVESIQDHRSDFEDGQMRYLVKWKGYEKKSDRTWETEQNFDGARAVLMAYWEKIGGKPTADGKPPTAKKRSRQSQGTPAKTPDTAKRAKTTKSGRKSNGAMQQDVDPSLLVGYTEVGEDDWKPPAPKDGAWDPLVQSVDTVIRENSDGELWGYLIWNDKNPDGRFYRSKAKLPVIYKACPQRMLHFYEKHLVFSTAGENDTAEGEEGKGTAA